MELEQTEFDLGELTDDEVGRIVAMRKTSCPYIRTGGASRPPGSRAGTARANPDSKKAPSRDERRWRMAPKSATLNWQFAAGAAVIPAIVGVSSRLLQRSPWAVPRWASQGGFLVANGVAAYFAGGPFLWGALLGQVPIAVDILAEEVAALVMPPHRRTPEGAAAPAAAAKGWMGSAEPDAQGRAAGQVTAEDIAELERLQQELRMAGTRNLGYRDREDTKLGSGRLASAPARFR